MRTASWARLLVLCSPLKLLIEVVKQRPQEISLKWDVQLSQEAEVCPGFQNNLETSVPKITSFWFCLCVRQGPVLLCILCTSCVSQPRDKRLKIYLFVLWLLSELPLYSPPKVNKISSWCEERGRGMPDEQQLGEAQSPGNHLQAARSFVGCKQKTKMLLGMAGKTARDRQQGRARVMLPATVFKKYRPVFSKGSADSTEGTTKPSEMPVPRCLLLSSRTGAPKPPGRPFTITSAPGNTQTLEAVQSPGKQMELLVLDLGARGQLGTPLLF